MYRLPPMENYGVRGLCWRLAAPVTAGGIFFASYVSWRPGEIFFTLSDILFVLAVGLMLGARRLPLQPLGPFTSWWFVSVMLMLAGLFLGSAFAGVPDRWLTVAAQYGFALIVLPMLLLQQPAPRLLMFFKALLAGIFCMELFGIALYFGYDGTYQEFKRFGPDFVTGARRLGAFLGDANWNSAAITLAFPFALFLRLRRKISAITFLAILVVFVLALILAASVTGLISFVLSVILFGVIGKVMPSFKILLLLASLVAIPLATGFGMPRAFSNRVAPALESGEIEQAGTFGDRMDLMVEAWNIVEDTIVVGIGVDQFREISVDEAPVHNMFLLLWAEGGLPALIGWLSLMAAVVTIGWFAAARDRLAAALTFSVLSTFVIFANSSPHMYGRLWLAPLFLAMAPALAVLMAGSERRRMMTPADMRRAVPPRPAHPVP